MRDIKANSSRFVRMKNRLFAWQDGYAGVSVSPSQIAIVKAYIANQQEILKHGALRTNTWPC
jgi:hypothetical protein